MVLNGNNAGAHDSKYSPAITVQHYIRRNEMVNPATAEMLERALGKKA